MLIVNVATAVAPAASVACAVKVKEPGAVAVPVSAPVSATMETPFGRSPLKTDQV